MNNPQSKEAFKGIKSWAVDDRPREKLVLKGKAALSNAELLAILIGSGTTKLSALDLAKDVLSRAGDNLKELGKMSIDDLCKSKGIGEARAITIAAAVELGRRRKDEDPLKRTQVRSSRDVYEYLYEYLADLPHEEFYVLLLSRSNKIIGHECISRGGVSGTVADAKLIFLPALQKLASGIILAHNHPSGNLRPSRPDIALTQKIKSGAEVLDLQLFDHVIVAEGGYFSFADEGLL